MRNGSSNVVVEDIWINTRARLDDAERPAAPADPAETTDWDDLEQENALLNPDPAIPDRG